MAVRVPEGPYRASVRLHFRSSETRMFASVGRIPRNEVTTVLERAGWRGRMPSRDAGEH